MGAEVTVSSLAANLEQPKCTVIKSPSDEREYEILHLPNGLCALLIHDPKITDESGAHGNNEEGDDEEEYDDDNDSDSDEYEDEDCLDCAQNGGCAMHNDTSECGSAQNHDSGSTKKMAAAALSVGVGSFADPKDAQGLFHFLEHMLFMGSSKFPDENEYDSFLSKHGGSSNAFTETEHTCYYFEVNHKFLKPALDRFSQFFISPLIKGEAMEREVQAVDSEFEGHLQSDGVRLSQLQCNTADQHHPFNCFSWGNRKSLSEPVARGVDMRGKLLEMYDKYYHAGRMKLTVVSGEPLETLKSWVTELFNGIRPGFGSPLHFEWEGPVWEPGKLYRVKSVKDQHFISIIWPFPCLKDAYLKKPYDYISHLVGHEGTGSLFSLLKHHGWATHLSAGVGEGGFERCSAGYMFNVNIYLTDSGLDQVDNVIDLLYQYLKMLRDIGPQEWVHEEIQAMTNMEFQFVEEIHPDTYAVNLATNMHLYPEKHVIYGDFALEMWDPNLVQSMLNLMVPTNMRLDIVTKCFDEKATNVQTEPWFEFPYVVEDIPHETMARWENPKCVNPMLHMPLVNEFIPTDFSIRNGNFDGMDVESPPRVIKNDSLLKLWYKPDTKFQTPRTNAYFRVSCLGALDTVRGYVLTELYVKLLKDALNEMLYLANVAKLESSLSFVSDGLELKLYGFSHKLPVLASRIASFVKSFVPTSERFQVMKEELTRAYRNANMKPSKHSTYLRLQILKERSFEIEDRKDVLNELCVDDVISFTPTLLGRIFIEAFLHGNLSEEEAVTIARVFKDSLASDPLPNAGEPKERILKVPLGLTFIHNTDAINPVEENSAVELYFQIDQDDGERSLRMRAVYDLFESIISEPYFNELRTQEQLGYSLSSTARLTYRILGFSFRVISAKYSPPYVIERIEKFIKTFRKHLDDMTDEEFQSYVDALIEVKMESDHNLMEETDRLWLQIAEKRYIFDISKREAEELRSITKAEVMNLYDTYFTVKSPCLRKLMVCVWGSNARGEDHILKKKSLRNNEVITIDNLSEFKNNNEFYPALC
ncbi:hypothetical protein KP509_33G029900 [Ceratopteris richardii]|nr:hypothetical protein KP509_33G029900 [Ceratopteris richardii]